MSLIRCKKYQSYKGAYRKTAPNLLKHQFIVKMPNQKWVTDITKFYVNGLKLYLSPIMNLYIQWGNSFLANIKSTTPAHGCKNDSISI